MTTPAPDNITGNFAFDKSSAAFDIASTPPPCLSNLSVKAAQIDEEKSLVAKFGEGATKSGATLKGIFEKALGRKSTKKKDK